MTDLLPLIERLGSMGILAALLWWVFGRMGPKIVQQFHSGLNQNTQSLHENTRALREITEETRDAHREIMSGIKDMAENLSKHQEGEEVVLREIADSLKTKKP